MSNYVENGEATPSFICASDRPNVFLIGDSIRRGYCATVESLLADDAAVFYLADNCRSSQYIIFSIKKWSAMFDDPTRVDVVHFNCGQWDAAHWSGHEFPLTSESEYEKNLQIIIDLLKKHFPNARLAFATTSPMNPVDCSGVNPRTNEEIDRYNAIARTVMKRNGIPVNDINGYMRPFGGECYKDLCHLTKDAFAMLGEHVAKWLKNYLAALN